MIKTQNSKLKTQNFPDITVASVGHIDHGKSSLIGRLLYDSRQIKPDKIVEWKKTGGNNFAFLLDSFEDEQKDEMTIDVFYSQFKTSKFHFTLIDDPGHLEFIKNMLTGVSQASGVILVVSAKPEEGIQFQTKRHMMLVKLLGINQVLAVINKMDLVDYDQKIFIEIKKEVSNFLQSVGFDVENIPFVPASAFNGDNVYNKSSNMLWYQGKTFFQLLDEVFSPPKLPIDKPLRIIFQGSYSLNDKKIVFGRIDSGVLKKGDKIILLPAKIKAEVLEIKGTSGEKDQLLPFQTAGIVLSAQKLPERIEEQVGLNEHNIFQEKNSTSGEIFLLFDEPINSGDLLTFRCGTREIPCKIRKILKRIDSQTGEVIEENAKLINPAEMAEVEILFEKPTVIEKFADFPTLGRFLLFRSKKNIAAGITIV